MARKRRTSTPTTARADAPAASASSAEAVRRAPAPAAAPGLPAEPGPGDFTVPLLAAMMFLAPALGVPNEEMLQDTLKSIVVSFFALAAALLFFLRERRGRDAIRWHGVLVLPLLLMVYALGSMVWSHTYLGGVEAVRWFVFALIAWLALQTLSRERLPWLAWGVHAGAVVASLWAVLQFWFDFRFFPQGPNPGSTFVNRNFFAEFAVCTLPFTALLLARARQSAAIAFLAATGGLVIVSIMMTGTRAALMALWLLLGVVFPLIAWRCRRELAFAGWGRGLQGMAVGVLLSTVVGLGLIPSGNAKILEEERGRNAIERSINRTQAIRVDDYSLGVRMIMWRATLNAIRAEPVTGVGAGAWESEIPLYQAEDAQIETDYYVHNEFLQLVAEYGLVGWAFLLALFGYLLNAAWRTWRADTPLALAEAPGRALVLASLLALLVVSNIGFPWRLAATGALFAACLGALAASDARLGWRTATGVRAWRWNAMAANAGVAASVACLALALYITQRAAEAERKIVQATKIALAISGSRDPQSAHWKPAKERMLQLIGEGIQLNPHYRKITPMVADELARWGDWGNAIWIWESVLKSRPHVVAMMSNMARGYSTLGKPEAAAAWLAEAKKLRPKAPAVRSLEVILLSRSGQEARALALAKEAIAEKAYDFDLINAAFALAWRSGDYALAEQAIELRIAQWPESRARAYLQLGNMYSRGLRDDAKAQQHYARALALAQPGERQSFFAQMPADMANRLSAAGTLPRGTTQTSASSK